MYIRPFLITASVFFIFGWAAGERYTAHRYFDENIDKVAAQQAETARRLGDDWVARNADSWAEQQETEHQEQRDRGVITALATFVRDTLL